jgi:hypothetical protein
VCRTLSQHTPPYAASGYHPGESLAGNDSHPAWSTASHPGVDSRGERSIVSVATLGGIIRGDERESFNTQLPAPAFSPRSMPSGFMNMRSGT